MQPAHPSNRHAPQSHHADGHPSPANSSSNRHRASQHAHSTAPTSPNDSSVQPVNMVGPSHPMPRQRVYFGPYLLLQTLGEGEFGKVKLGVHSSPERWGEEVAIKLIKRGNVDTQARMIKVAREIDVLKLVKHPNIVRLYDVIETEKYIGIVLEYASGGELFDHILAHRYLKEKDASKLFAQLISGVTYLHNKKIVHRDLKLENLLLDRNRNIIITDFGFANRFEDRSSDLMATSCGSPCYAAPELVVQDGRYVGSQVDVWSCGVILYAMLAGYLPFDDDPSNPDGDNINLLYKYIINTPLSFPEWITDEPKDLLLKMLVPDPLKRCSLKDVTSHPWLAKYQHLFHRSLEELERLSEENEQAKRLMLQRQRQLMAAGNANGARPALGLDGSRSQSTANGLGAAATKARGHQSAMVVPSSALADEPLVPGHSPSAYQQQQRQSGAVTYLQSTVQSPTGIPIPTNRRNQQAQSAMIVPVSNQNKENEGLATATHEYTPYTPPAPKDKMALEGESASSVSSGKKRRVAGGSSPNTTSGHPSAPPNQQRYTVQVEYSGGPSRADAKGKGKIVEPEAIGEDDMMVDGTTLGDTVAGEDDTVTQMVPVVLSEVPTTPVSARVAELRTTPQPSRVKGPGSATSIISRSASTKEDGQAGAAAAQHVPFPSPEAPKVPLNHGAVDRITGGKNASGITNQSQVSFGTTSQSSTQPNGGHKTDGSKASSRHRKGLSTDRFFSRLLGNAGASSSQIAQPGTTPPPLPHGKKSTGYTTAPSNPVKTARRKAMSMVVEPLSGKIASTAGAARASRKSGKLGEVNVVAQAARAEEAKRRARGTSVAASPAVSSSSSGLPNQPQTAAVPFKRRITLTAGNRRAEEARATGVKEASADSPPPQVVVSMRPAAGAEAGTPLGPAEEEGRSRREAQSSSPNWSSHTGATAGAQSTGHASNSSKAKRVMDWFRFKSLNSSTTSTHQQGPAPAANDHLQPPTPIRTDFDTRRKGKDGNKNGPPSSSGSTVIVNTTDCFPSGTQAEGARTAGPPRPNATSKASHRFTLAHPRPNTSTATAFGGAAPPALVVGASGVPASQMGFNDSKLKLHHGAIDQNAISSRSPVDIMGQLKQILWELGIDVVEENAMKLKATRRSKKKVVASLGLGVFEALQQQQQQQQHGSFKAMFQRKGGGGSQIGVLIDQFGQVSTGGAAGGSVGAAPAEQAQQVVQQQQLQQQTGPLVQPLPSYADDPSVDSGDDVRFTVEITRLRGLVGLYAVDIKRLKGSLWSFKYLYLQILERADLGKKAS